MARQTGSKSSVPLTLERLNAIFGGKGETKIQVSKGWLKSAAEFLDVNIPEANESGADATTGEVTVSTARPVADIS